MPDMSQEEYEAQADLNWQRRQAAAAAERWENEAAMQRTVVPDLRVTPSAPAPAVPPPVMGTHAMEYRTDPVTGKKQFRTGSGAPWQDDTGETTPGILTDLNKGPGQEQTPSYRIDPVTGKRQIRSNFGANALAWSDIPEGQIPNFDELLKAQEAPYDKSKTIVQPPDSGTGSSVPIPPAAGTGTGASSTPPPPTAAPNPFDFNTLDDAGKQALFQSMRPWLQQQRSMRGGMATQPPAAPPAPEAITDPTTGSIITPDHPGYNQLRKTLGMPDLSAQPAVSPAAYKYSRFPSLGGGMPSPRGWEQGQGHGWGRGRGRGWGMGGRWGGPGEAQTAPPGPGEVPFQSPNKTPSGLYNDPRLKPVAPPRNSFASQNPYTGFSKPPGMAPTPKPAENKIQPTAPGKVETL